MYNVKAQTNRTNTLRRKNNNGRRTEIFGYFVINNIWISYDGNDIKKNSKHYSDLTLNVIFMLVDILAFSPHTHMQTNTTILYERLLNYLNCCQVPAVYFM